MKEHAASSTGWSAATRKTYGGCAQTALKILGDVPVGTLDRATMVNYRKDLLKVPQFWTTRFKNVPVEDLPIPNVPTIKKKDRGTEPNVCQRTN